MKVEQKLREMGLELPELPKPNGLYAPVSYTHLDILVNQNRMLLGYLVDDADEFVDILIAYGNLHTLSAQHVGWPHQHRIAKLMGCFLCLLGRKYSMSCGPWDIALLQDCLLYTSRCV